ncbi:MATE family efflux transporter [Streptomyces avermitilis]|uniref:DNA-damage-inducible protein F n=3 Tax=Streptomyces TaxID=1883 RepID=Q82FG7_STRAW|nr:putative DNA-damage-inducible protein F [Streptomyces avermitilis MA-4680 = NBRC 14893]BBJ52282.1 MATE family efflux transporter [Streptomyces avermitilis]GDY64317.1 MATE family efflux transporter [Streptomyces avermitilis]GDY75523.1 MATE family efflux transporter [Streptomyces avermitilis]GDY84503.1 MATE family efflux transporter [Streptomyces avermitilis]
MVAMTQAPARPSAARRRHDREIVALAVPAFGALVAEPLFVMADSAIVGHLGTAQLAGLGVASALLTTAVSVFVFLAYATTAAVARRVGAGDLRAAIRQGMDGIWLALLLGAVVIAVFLPTAPAVVDLFGASETAAPYAITYLRISALGIPAMLVVLAATGVLRGLQDTKTPLYVAVAGFVANAVLNVVLVYGAGLGIAGSAWGTVIAQYGMAVAYLYVVVRGARKLGAPLRPDIAGIRACAQAGAPLLVRTLSLRAVLMIATAVAARLGDADIAAHQIILSLWSLLAFALDAIAIAGQAIIGRYLGAGDTEGARAACRRMVEWGIAAGVVLGLLVVVARPLFLPLFTGDSAVKDAALPALLLVALSQPICGVVFVLDGVLMGAGDGLYLAWAMLLTLAVFTPVALLVPMLGGGLTALWGAMTLMMTVRMLTLWLRSRSGRWIVTGASR